VTLRKEGGHFLSIQGRLEAIGTQALPIRFTGIPSRLDPAVMLGWGGLFFDGAAGDGSGNLTYTTVERGGNNFMPPGCVGVTCAGQNAVFVKDLPAAKQLNINYSSIEKSLARGLYIVNSIVNVTNTTFSQNIYPIWIEGADSVVSYSGNNFVDNTYGTSVNYPMPLDAIVINADALMGHDFSLPAQNGLDFYVFPSGTRIPFGRTMTVEPGVTLRTAPDKYLTVQGQLNAVGTQALPIRFSGIPHYDDLANIFNWSGLYFEGTSGDGSGTLTYTIIERGGSNFLPPSCTGACGTAQTAVFVKDLPADKPLNISHSIIENSVSKGLYVVNSPTAQLNGNLIKGGRIGAYFVSDITVSNLALIDQVLYGVYVNTGYNVDARHLTIARAGQIGFYTAGTGLLKNSILSQNLLAVKAEGSGQATLDTNLADGNTTFKSGNVSEANTVPGSADFEADGYHIQTISDAVGQGLPGLNVTVDIDGEARPSPADSFPDLGADEVPVGGDQAPTDISISASSLTENLSAGTTVGTLSTVDPDAGDTHTYSFCGGMDDASFALAGNALNTAAIFDYETKNSYAICLRTDDGHGETFDKNFTITVTDIPNVELLVPTNGITLLTNRPTFDWVNFAGAIGYNIQISKNVGFTQLVSNTNLTGATNSSYIPTANLIANTNMWWRVRAKLTATTYSGWSEVRSFTTANPPPAPVLTAPASNVLVTTATTFLNWNDVVMPSGTTFQKYEIELATNSTFTTGKVNAEALISEATSPALTPNTKVYWHVRAYNTLGQYGAWSASRYFRVALSAPNTLLPGTITPPGSANNIHMRRPTFTWEAVAGVTGYTLEVSTVNTFATKVINKTVTTVSYTHTADLAANTTFFWRVKSNGANGPSLYSQVRTFTTGNPPSIPTLSTPAANALVTTTTPLLDWSNATVPAGSAAFHRYEVQIATNSTFTAGVTLISVPGVTTNSQVTAPALLNATTYYWRVRSVNVGLDSIGGNADDDFSGWSASHTLRTPFAAPTLTLPLNGATGVALKPTFTWIAIAGATNYTLQVSTSPSFATLAINKTVTGTSYTHTTNLSAGTVYYWRLRANGPYGPGEWSSFSFTTQ
jgi:hypothetical protein